MRVSVRCVTLVIGGGHTVAAMAVVFAVIVSISGCTTLQPTPLPPEELRAGIRDGSLVEAGDEIVVFVADGTEYALRVWSVDENDIRGASPTGSHLTVAVDDVIAVRTRQIEPVRTMYAVSGGLYLGAMATMILLIMIPLAL